MSSVITYKNNIPNLGCYEGKAFKFIRTVAGTNKYAYAGSVEINDDTFTIIHDATTNVVVFRNEENEIYERYSTNANRGMQEMISK